MDTSSFHLNLVNCQSELQPQIKDSQKFAEKTELPRKEMASMVSNHSQLTTLQAMNATSLQSQEIFDQGQSQSEFCENCLKEGNAMQTEIYFLRALLRKHKIKVPDFHCGQKQYGYSDLVPEANKIIEDLKSQIAKFEKES